MTITRFRFPVFALIFLLAASAAVTAQATRTWVSGVGDDVNPCSRTAPCKTFAGAISKTAASGEINCLDSGGFGSVTITKSMTIDCKGVIGGVLAAQINGIIVNAPNAVVTVRGLDINGAGNGINGIRIMSAAVVNVEDTVIYGFTQNGLSIDNPADTRVTVVINRSSIRNNLGHGVNSSPAGTAEVSVVKSLLSGNNAGISVGATTTCRISGNSIVANKIGLFATAPGKIISSKDNFVDGNGTNGAPTSTSSLM